MASPQVMTQREFAKKQKLSVQRVKQLVTQGLPTANGKILSSAATRWIKANVDSARKDNWNGASLNDLRRQREQQKVEAGKIELARTRGELIEQAAVAKFISDRARMERDAWLAWASAAAARIATTCGLDHGQLFTALEREVRAQLQHLSATPIADQ